MFAIVKKEPGVRISYANSARKYFSLSALK